MSECINHDKLRKTKLLGYGNSNKADLKMKLIELIVGYKKCILDDDKTTYIQPTEEYFNNHLTHNVVETLWYDFLNIKE